MVLAKADPAGAAAVMPSRVLDDNLTALATLEEIPGSQILFL